MAEDTTAKKTNGLWGFLSTIGVSGFLYLTTTTLMTRDLPPWSAKLLGDYGPVVLLLAVAVFLIWWLVPRNYFLQQEMRVADRIELARLSERIRIYDNILQLRAASLIKDSVLHEIDELIDLFSEHHQTITVEELNALLVELDKRDLDDLKDPQRAGSELIRLRVKERLADLASGEVQLEQRHVSSIDEDKGKSQDVLEQEQVDMGERKKKGGGR